MRLLTFSAQTHSSCEVALSDDRLKDADNAAWVLELDPLTREQWLERIAWIRLVDRLAEAELLNPQNQVFQQFLAHWHRLQATGEVDLTYRYATVLLGLRDRGEPPMLQAWEQYLSAIEHYHQPHLVFQTLEQFEQMLVGLGGALFQILPCLPAGYQTAIWWMGALDQCYNILRDLQEDAIQGICYLPLEILHRFGVTREELLNLTAPNNPGYQPMMQFWCHEYLPHLHHQATTLLSADDLPASWGILREWSLHRYQRIERVLQDSQLNYLQFPDDYWRRVRRELPHLREELRTQLQKGHWQSASVAWSRQATLRSR